MLRDAEGTVGNDYRLTGLPTTFVLDSSGRIRSVLRGPQDAGTLAHAMASVPSPSRGGLSAVSARPNAGARLRPTVAGSAALALRIGA